MSGKIVEKIGNRVRVCTVNEEPSRTSQEFKDEVDSSKIMERYFRTGQFPSVRSGGVYSDFSQFDDLVSAIEVVEAAGDMFRELPSKVRKRFANDPAELVRFLQDPKNLDEAVSLGLVSKPKAAKPPIEESAPSEPIETKPDKKSEKSK